MSKNVNIVTPVGRLVQGNLYLGSDKDANGQPLFYKKGTNAGKPRVNFYFAIAVPKGKETHWNQTEWGKIIHQVAIDSHPGGQWQRPDFAWKVSDGDSTIPNTEGRRPCDYEGFSGSWILRTSGSFAPKLFNATGKQSLPDSIKIETGYFIQAYLTVAPNKSDQKPGLYLNHSMVAFSGYGPRIIVGPDAGSVGFGAAPLPPGASLTPVDSFVPPAEGNNMFTQEELNEPAAPPPAPAPYPEILNTPVRVMLEAAKGHTYEQYKSAGWTDEQLIKANFMAP